MIEQEHEEETVLIEAPKTAVCDRCFLYRALNGTCECDE